MTFLVTGGAGFIGSNLSQRLLKEGHAVVAYDNLDPFYPPAYKLENLAQLKESRSFQFVEGDILDADGLEDLFSKIKFDQIIHLAAKAGVGPSLKDPVAYQSVNVVGTNILLEAARRHEISKITIASSSSVYGVNSKTPFSESDPIFTPISPYAASKLACEALGHVYAHTFGMDVVMLRFFTVYGPLQRPDLAIHKFAAAMLRGEPIQVFGDGSSARDYTYVSDTVDGIIACTKGSFGYEIFNLGESQTVKLSYMIELLEKNLGRKAMIKRLPNQPGDVPLTYADISKARARLGYNPHVAIEEGIALFLDWFKRSNRV
jgi:UDP-glucuronate 4-epimerase